MKLTIKTLDQKSVIVDFDESKTVWDLKQHLSSSTEIGGSPDSHQLIYSGRILNNEHKLKTYSIDERKFLVIMIRKNLPTSEERRQRIKEAKEREMQSSTTQAEQQGAPKDVTFTSPPVTDVLNLPPMASINEDLAQSIMAMGYAESDVRRALTASFNNPDRAIEYLIEGIPDVPELIAAPALGSVEEENPLEFLRHDPRFANMRDIVRRNPEMLGAMLQRISAANPSLFAVIQEHQDHFIRLINEDPAGITPTLPNVVLTPAENTAVERIVAMGFPRDIVIQAYIVCNKDEAQTADFLCRHLED